MKKILFAVLAASLILPVSAMAEEVTLYGSFNYSVSMVESDGVDNKQADDNTPLLGVKGSYGDDIKAFFHLQMEAQGDAGNAADQRFYFGGLKGSFGTVKYGLLSNAYKMPGFKLDPFYNIAHVKSNGKYATGGATYGLSGINNGFTEDALEYTSPKIADSITVNVGYYFDESTAEEDASGFGVTYAANGITAGVQMISEGKNGGEISGATLGADSDATRVHANFKGEGFSAGVSYEIVETSTTMEPTFIFLAGTYDISDKTQLRATYGIVDDESVQEGSGFTIGAFHALVPNTKVFALYSKASLDDPTGIHTEDDPTVLSIGVQHNFSMSK